MSEKLPEKARETIPTVLSDLATAYDVAVKIDQQIIRMENAYAVEREEGPDTKKDKPDRCVCTRLEDNALFLVRYLQDIEEALRKRVDALFGDLV